jgi:S-adenosylmethionine:tRNA ribosyltransferase-isomerase
MTDLDSVLRPYDYEFPQELIATEPAHPRDSARLLIYDRATGDTSFDTFSNITKYLPKDAVLVFNQTKVIPARMQLKKDTGGGVEALYIGPGKGHIRVMASGKIAAGDKLDWEGGHSFTVKERDGKYAHLVPSFAFAELYSLLEKYGETPLPPYIKDSPLTEEQRRTEYQTVYATQEGSVAAPTAGLHFTPELLEKIREHGCEIAYVTLHVNLGTFAPLTEEHIASKKLHTEYYEINRETADMLNEAKAADRPIIAVGTTSVRTLESAAVFDAESDDVAHLENLRGNTNIFITDDDWLKFTDGLITNFHVPKSSLLMLVSAFTGREKLMEIYAEAIDEKMRLFSFGDGMMVI